MIKITQHKESGLIHVKRAGIISGEDLIDYIRNIHRNYSGQNKLYLLDDARGSDMNINHQSGFEKVIRELQRYMVNYESVHVAIVADSPALAAMSDIYEMMSSKVVNYYFKLFSTTEAAHNWLLLRRSAETGA